MKLASIAGQFAFAGVQENGATIGGDGRGRVRGCTAGQERKARDRGGSTLRVARREAHLYKRGDDFSSR